MPRNASGDYTLPAGNPVADGTIISPIWANPTMNDLGSEITNSLDRNGRGGMLVAFQNVDGSAALPAITFTNEPSTGLYRAGSEDVRMSVGGNDTTRWINATGQAAGLQQPFEIWDGSMWNKAISSGNLKASNWTPSLNFGGATTGIEYTSRTGRKYVLNNKWAMYVLDIQLSSKGAATGNASITGVDEINNLGTGVYFPISRFRNQAIQELNAVGRINSGISTINLRRNETGISGAANIDNTFFTDTTFLQMQWFMKI